MYFMFTFSAIRYGDSDGLYVVVVVFVLNIVTMMNGDQMVPPNFLS